MALSATQKYETLMYLGYNSGCIIPNNAYYSNKVVDAFAALPEELEPKVIELLARLATLESQRTTALKRAGVKRIDDIELNGEEMSALRKEKHSVLMQLASIFGFEVRSGSSMGNVSLS